MLHCTSTFLLSHSVALSVSSRASCTLCCWACNVSKSSLGFPFWNLIIFFNLVQIFANSELWSSQYLLKAVSSHPLYLSWIVVRIYNTPDFDFDLLVLSRCTVFSEAVGNNRSISFMKGNELLTSLVSPLSQCGPRMFWYDLCLATPFHSCIMMVFVAPLPSSSRISRLHHTVLALCHLHTLMLACTFALSEYLLVLLLHTIFLTILLAILLCTTIACWGLLPLEWCTIFSPLLISPNPFHCTSLTPVTDTVFFCTSLFKFSNFLAWFKVLTFQVPIL